MKNSTFPKKFKHLIEKLSSEPIVGAIRVTDNSLQYAVTREEKVTNFIVSFPLGTMKEGIIQNPQAFSETLEKLHNLIAPDKKNLIIKISASLPPAIVYTQGFRIPYVDDNHINESASLNLQMISPMNMETAYMSWQKIGETDGQLELLGAFVSKEALDKIRFLMITANFQPISFEFPGLGIARVVEHVLGQVAETIILLEISSDGIDFLLIKDSALRFDYFISWNKIRGSEKEITKEIFNQALARELQKVINFTQGHFKETPEQILAIAPNLETTVQELLKQLNFKTAPFPAIYNLDPSWAGVIGASLKNVPSNRGARPISLGISPTADIFFEERFERFVVLWRNIGAIALLFLIFLNGGIDLVLRAKAKSLDANVQVFRDRGQNKEITMIEDKAVEFNRLVAAAEPILNSTPDWVGLFDKIFNLMRQNSITPAALTVNSSEFLISLNANGQNQSAVLAFKNLISISKEFTNVDLPLSRINVAPNGSVNFFISFKLKQ